MRREVQQTGAFRKDVKRLSRRGKDLAKLDAVVALLAEGDPLPARCRPHRLTGTWAGFLECHVEPDWLLIWLEDEAAIVLTRTGSHADLFD